MAEFEDVQKTDSPRGLVGEFFYFLRTSQKWWLLPILAVLLLCGGLVFLSGTAAAPFIYTLF
jgi:hypothetical protein